MHSKKNDKSKIDYDDEQQGAVLDIKDHFMAVQQTTVWYNENSAVTSYTVRVHHGHAHGASKTEVKLAVTALSSKPQFQGLKLNPGPPLSAATSKTPAFLRLSSIDYCRKALAFASIGMGI